MNFPDPIYGNIAVAEPVLVDLLQTRAMQRLGGVLQHGITALIGITRPVSRLEHSLGVMHLVRLLGSGLEEQVAALLHDVSHTAFSHVIDYVFQEHERQGFHEDHKEPFLAGSDLPETLAAHGYDWRIFLDDARFTLLEQPAPALCADRLDYFLRDSRDLGLASRAEIGRALASLAVHRGQIVTTSVAAARWMADTYLLADQASWANLREVALYELAAQAIRRGLQIGALHTADLWTTDAQAWEKLAAFPDETLQAQIRLVSPATRIERVSQDADFWVATKLRTLDPGVLVGERVQPLSALDARVAQQRAAYLSQNAGKWGIKVVSGKEIPAAPQTAGHSEALLAAPHDDGAEEADPGAQAPEVGRQVGA